MKKRNRSSKGAPAEASATVHPSKHGRRSNPGTVGRGFSPDNEQFKRDLALAPEVRSSSKSANTKSNALPDHLVRIEKPIYGGNFLARENNKAIFIPLTLPGEQVRIRVIEERAKRGYALAELEEIITKSPDRIQPKCPHFGPCGGCNYQHTDYANQLRIKEGILRETLERGGVPAPEKIEILAADPWAYRNRIRIAFDAAGNPGYRGRRSHAVIPIRECPIAAPLLVRSALAAGELLARVPANLRPHELLLFCNPDESALLATFFVAEPTQLRLNPLAESLKAQIPEVAGVELASGGRPGHPPRTLSQWGAPSIAYRAAGFDYRVDHGGFFQVNRWLIDSLVDCVTAGQSGSLAWDLFAGVGLFARRLTSTFARVVAVESAPPAVSALEENLRDSSGSAVRATTLDFLRSGPSGAKPDLIVVDPPRIGLGPDITALLVRVAAPALVYVSCDPATLARDLKTLLAGGYQIQSLTLADLFPQTFHIETVVRLHRS